MVKRIRRAMERNAVATRRVLLLGIVLGIAAMMAVVMMSRDRHGNLYVIDETGAQNYGLATNHGEIAREVAAQLPPFELVGPDGQKVVQDNSRSTVLLWKAADKVLGRRPKHLVQQVGDCVSFGVANAVRYLLLVQMERNPGQSEFHDVFPPYIYGYSRVQIGGGRINGDGSTGAWGALAAKQGGILAEDDPGVPPYDGNVARKWGRTGPPPEMIAIAKQRLVRDVANMKSADDVRDAVCNGYPVTLASPFGSKRMIQQDGRIVAKRDGTVWRHQMCCIGYDGSGPRPYFYVLNSWPEDDHPAPLNGEPAGGFWVEYETMEFIVTSDDDCWAFSQFEGFPAQDIDPAFNIFSRTEPKADQPTRVAVRSFGGSRF